MLLLAACTRDNGAFDGAGGGGSAGEASTSRTDGADGPVPSTGSASGSASGSGVDGTAADDSPMLTTGTSSDATTSPEGTSTSGGSAEGVMSTGAADAPDPTTGDPPPGSCCDPFMPCENNVVSSCACEIDPECCSPGWGLYCVAVAMSQECLAGCFLPPQGCCDSFGVPGCNDPGIMACVCAQDASCCTVAWEGGCATLAAECPESPCL